MNEELFFQREQHLCPLYLALTNAIRSRCGEFTVSVKKTMISLSNRRLFACVSLPAPRKTKPAEFIILSICTDHCIDSPRISHASEPYPGRWTNHLRLHSDPEIDEDLLNWFSAAYAFALYK